jgi:hypothetical protein
MIRGGTFWYCAETTTTVRRDKNGNRTRYVDKVECNKRYRRPASLRRHMRRKHGAQI